MYCNWIHFVYLIWMYWLSCHIPRELNKTDEWSEKKVVLGIVPFYMYDFIGKLPLDICTNSNANSNAKHCFIPPYLEILNTISCIYEITGIVDYSESQRMCHKYSFFFHSSRLQTSKIKKKHLFYVFITEAEL